MIKKTITYTDYNGNERTEDFYFHLNRAELMEMELSQRGGLIAMIDRIVADQDGEKIINVFKDLILRSYGVKTPDGKRFIKSEELRREFEQTEAYSILFTELATNTEEAIAFFNKIIPETESGESKELPVNSSN